MRELYSYNQLCNSALDFSPAAGASSDSSSPRSSSTDDELLEVHRGAQQSTFNSSKPIYNFSIPDFIKHERQPVTSAADNSGLDSPVIVSECIARSRNVKRRFDYRDAAEDVEPRERINVTDNIVNCRRQKRRRINHRNTTQSPQFIDLTGGTDQEDAAAVGVVDEINHNPYLDSTLTGVSEHSRELGSNQHSHASVSCNSVAENLQDFRLRLRASRDRINQLRREVTARESRLMYRLSHRGSEQSQNIVSDGLAFTSPNDPDVRAAAPLVDNIDTFDFRHPAATVITVDDDNTETVTPDRDRDIAARMLEDPLYSPPFLTPRSVRRTASPRPAMLGTLEENLDRMNQRTRELERVRQQTRARISETRNRMSRIAQNHRIINDRFESLVYDSPQEVRQAEDEVEFLRELRRPSAPVGRNARASHTDLDASNETSYNWGHLSRARRRFSGLFTNPNMNVPDFLFPYVQLFSPAVAPRLHHFPSSNIDEGEDYEALWNLAERLGPAKPRGLNKTEIDRIRAFRFSAACAEDTNSTCVVCMSEYKYKEKIRKLPCTHDFHSKCIDKWLRANKTCPVCRDEVKCI